MAKKTLKKTKPGNLCLELKEHLRRGEKFYTKDEVATQLQVTPRQIENYIKSGELLAFKRGSADNAGVLIPEFAVANFLRAAEVQQYFS